MALVATVGLPSSNSYCTTAEADSYFDERLHGTAVWEAIDEQESALITMSRLLDSYISFKGVKTSDLQGLKWPRTGVIRPSGVEVASDIIPIEVKYAVYELVLSSATTDRTADDPLAGLSQATVGPLTVKTDGGGVTTTAKKVIPDHVRQLLSDLTPGVIGVVRLMRG